MKRALLFLLLLSACVPATPAVTNSSLPAVDGLGVGSPTPDLELESAFEEARATLGEFVRRIQTPNPARTFAALKVRFTHTDRTIEYIWVDNVTYENGILRGEVGDDLPDLRLTAGELITIPQEDIVDWMIVENGVLIGGFTIRLAYSRMTPEEQQRFLDETPYSLDE